MRGIRPPQRRLLRRGLEAMRPASGVMSESLPQGEIGVDSQCSHRMLSRSTRLEGPSGWASHGDRTSRTLQAA